MVSETLRSWHFKKKASLKKKKKREVLWRRASRPLLCRLLETTSCSLLPVVCHTGTQRIVQDEMHTNANQRNSYGSNPPHTHCFHSVTFRENIGRVATMTLSCVSVCPSAPLLASVEYRATNELLQKNKPSSFSWIGVLFAVIAYEFIVGTLPSGKT